MIVPFSSLLYPFPHFCFQHGTYLIFSPIMSHLEEFKIVSDIQHGFRKSYSCETQLRITLEDLAKNLDHGKQNDIILLDILKLLILSHTNASYSS